MDIKLNLIELCSFKGIKKLFIDLDGKSLDVRGTNATGKTTLVDAFTWLLFDKDSKGSSKFSLKTLAPDGKELNNLEHSVRAVFSIDDKTLELQKTYKENWTKKRGAVSKEFTGHSVDYSVNGVPVKEKEYNVAIKEFILEDDFKLLTMPDYFNSIKWQDRRALLLRLCGDVDMKTVIDSNDNLSGLSDFLGTHSIEEKRKIAASRQSAINNELSGMTARIDEHLRLISSGEKFPPIDSLQADCEALRKEIAEATATGGNAGLIRQRSELRNKLGGVDTA
jgi:AAA15 family ATPase/GTPase